jgi:hydroxymethylpyrimidine pyrophosphatase-like HAD family hydrolase
MNQMKTPDDPLYAQAKQILKNECGSSLRVTTSGGRYVEIAHPQTTKRNAMETLCERLGINANQVMAIGDNFNDLEMLAACGFGVAVANSPSEVKAVCRFVCKHEAARGVVEVLMAIVREFNYEVRRRLVETEKRV